MSILLPTACPLSKGLDTSLIPWPGMRYACIRVLELYCKVFNQAELYELIIRKTCNICKCPRSDHDVYHKEWVNVRERLGFALSSESQSESQKIKQLSMTEGFAWVPPGLNNSQIQEYFKQLPLSKVPHLGCSGEKYRDKQLIMQLPKQDLALNYCKHLDHQHRSSFEDFISARNEIALDIGYVKPNNRDCICHQCKKRVSFGEMVVIAPKFGDSTVWHPSCFICSVCRELLVDLTYCVHDGQLFCERHYAEQLKPRCAACDEVSVLFI